MFQKNKSNIFSSRRNLFRWIGWFFFANALLYLLIIANYLRIFPGFADLDLSIGKQMLAWIFFFFAFFVQWMIFFFSSALVPLLLVSIYPRMWVAIISSVMLTTILGFLIIADSILYYLYHMHIAGVGLDVFKADVLTEVIPLSSAEKWDVALIVCVSFLLQVMLAFLITRWVKKRKENSRLGFYVVMLAICAFTWVWGSFSLVQAFNSSYQRALLRGVSAIPYFNELYSGIMPSAKTQVIYVGNKSILVYKKAPKGLLRYPQKLQCIAPKTFNNVVVIVVDTWRHDALNAKLSPNLFKFSKKTLQFNNHWSGGNCTEPGIFSLFYSLPATYWPTFLKEQKGPVFFKALLQEGYQTSIFASASLKFPMFAQTVFRDIPNLAVQTPGKNSVERDRAITQKFTNFLETRNKSKPFFSFLFYDAVHNYCEPATPHQRPFKPAIKDCERVRLTKYDNPLPYKNRYDNAVYFVDQEIGKVIDALEKKALLNNTVVIITSDHGEEINDLRSGYWEHSSAYNQYQLRVPLLVYWPGRSAKMQSHLTTHHDIVPTLLSDVVGCQGEVADYSVGKSLLIPNNTAYFIAGSYGDYAIVTGQQAVRIRPSGDYTIEDQNGRWIKHPIPESQLDESIFKKAFRDLERFYEGNS